MARVLRYVAALALLAVCSATAASAANSAPMGDQVYGNCGLTDHGPGCDVPACEACVCAIMPECCTEDWDATCQFNTSQCPAECLAVVGDCGDPHPEPGCSDALCEACVCANFLAGSCCENPWSSSCALAADGVLFDNPTCVGVCLLANRTQPAPTLSSPALAAGLLAIGAIVWHRLRRRPTG
ncbi:MAG: hypothetical protein ACRERC_12670 [Candidatus Binatia bacterium]